MKKLLALAVVILGFTAVSFGQVSATATASATIVKALTLTNTANLNFGNITTTGAGKVVVSVLGVASYPDVTVTAYGVPGTISAASFDIVGSPSATYSIAAIAPVIVKSGTTNQMTVDAFVTNPALSAGVLDAAGKQTIKVGATLNVGAAQPGGLYTSVTPITVTVNYN